MLWEHFVAVKMDISYLVIFYASSGSRHREVCKVLQSDLPPQLLVLRQLRDVRAAQLHPALRPVPDDRQLPQQEVQMVGGTKAWAMCETFPGMAGRLLSITTSTLRRRGGVLNWD